ncbi:FtsX-like permease family protein [Schleiferilactobacillus harbinensis]|jgi:putative ABC transport system permease protein|uniref:ABC transporter permease n=2 Tax=Schleiferilactobacillus harbinensis TaxID=304207 RepID=A0ABU7SY73_9LACO|nr:ABC transporter permease [Schleiferilactobacillus harbinensis]KRM25049.1 ABC transporter, permease protein [Schleiferilactobacillus harbinensis DSM 16991]MCI1850396.1 ABC transporter permease [Schleiferilactobacillus harbinensis]MCT2909138.1 FtsX-like permease family protein [Schleiferilactobacillus harbinensis]QFR62570.1 FtsX-like permease family protein [Schleiferilactobacillus harbinensis]
MTVIESFKMAIEAITANKMRSFLTMLGIIIGIAAVIAILAIGNGATTKITGTFNDLGATTISLSVSNKAGNDAQLTAADLQAIKQADDRVTAVSPNYTLSGFAATNTQDQQAIIFGGTPDLQYTSTMMDSTITAGRYFTQADYAESAPVAVISADGAAQLFPNQRNVVGQTITLRSRTTSISVRLIGETQSTVDKYQGAVRRSSFPVYVAIPYSTMKLLSINAGGITDVTMKVRSRNDITSVSQSTVRLLETRHDVVGEQLYTARNFLSALDQVDSVLGLFVNFIAAVAAIALIVGGIGVMNIMLVSVTERTREIGTRKALGATTRDILIQFLLEAVILSLIGGLIGLTLGIAVAEIVANVLGITARITWQAILLVLLFASAVGVFFGLYPARKAAKLNPIEALRYE